MGSKSRDIDKSKKFIERIVVNKNRYYEEKN
jgi:hypothetical protein